MPHKYTTLPVVIRFQKHVKISESGCHEWISSLNNTGYGRFELNGKTHSAHRIAWELANGPIPEGMCVLHHCDNRRCVNPKHLFLGSLSDNALDAVAKGRIVSPKLGGENHPMVKLTKEKVLEIRASHTKGETQKDIAVRHNISQTHVSSIVRRKTWKHI